MNSIVKLCGISLLAFPIQLCAAESGTASNIRHRFLAVDTLAGKQGLHYVDQVDSKNDWSVTGVWRDIQLIGDHRVALSDGVGISIVDMKSRQIVGTVHPKGLKNVLSSQVLPDGNLIISLTGQGLTVTDPLGIYSKELFQGNVNGMVRQTSDGGWTTVVNGNAKGKKPDGWCGLELAADGTEKNRFPLPGCQAYLLCKLENGNYLFSAKYTGFAAEVKPNGEIQKRFATEQKFFYSGFQVLGNGNLVLANWIGHNEGERRKPNQGEQILEFAPDGKVVWSYKDLDRLGCIHGVIVLDDLDPALPYQQIYGKMQPFPNLGTPKVSVSVSGNSLDGIAVLPGGALAISVPNLNDRSLPPQVTIVTADGKTTQRQLPAPAPGSERVVPFGQDATADGTIYLADNQFFSEKTPKPKSRLLCLKPDGTSRVVATGLTVANGVRITKDFVFVTDSQVALTSGSKPVLTSAVYRFPLSGENLDLGAEPLKSPYLLVKFETPINRDPFGTDGITFDTEGRCLVSFFDLGRLVRFPISPDGKVGAIETLIPDGILPSGDGLAFDPASGAVFIADPRSNSIHRWHSSEGLSIFTRRSQPMFNPGCLDSPVDVAIRDGNLLIVNWTSAKRECVISMLPLTTKP